VEDDSGAVTIDSMKTPLLIMEDETAFPELLAGHLAREGFDRSEITETLGEAAEAFQRNPPDLVLFDVMLPDGDGRELCRDIRNGSDVPIILLSASGEEVDSRFRPSATQSEEHP